MEVLLHSFATAYPAGADGLGGQAPTYPIAYSTVRPGSPSVQP